MSFTDIQKKQLQEKLDPKFVSQRKQSGMNLDYIEGWRAIDEANRIFGFDGWTRELVSLVENTPPTQNKNGNSVVSFRATVRVTACGIVREGTGFGSGISFSIHDAYESAIKEAETDAMKRAMMTFGNPFGLALYDKTKANVGTSEPANTQKPASKNDDARALFSKLQKAIDELLSDDKAKAWWKDNFTDIKRLPEDWQDDIKGIFKSKRHELNKEAA